MQSSQWVTHYCFLFVFCFLSYFLFSLDIWFLHIGVYLECCIYAFMYMVIIIQRLLSMESWSELPNWRTAPNSSLGWFLHLDVLSNARHFTKCSKCFYMALHESFSVALNTQFYMAPPPQVLSMWHQCWTLADQSSPLERTGPNTFAAEYGPSWVEPGARHHSPLS